MNGHEETLCASFLTSSSFFTIPRVIRCGTHCGAPFTPWKSSEIAGHIIRCLASRQATHMKWGCQNQGANAPHQPWFLNTSGMRFPLRRTGERGGFKGGANRKLEGYEHKLRRIIHGHGCTLQPGQSPRPQNVDRTGIGSLQRGTPGFFVRCAGKKVLLLLVPTGHLGNLWGQRKP